MRGVSQHGDRIYVVCARYGTVEVFSASDCRWLERVVITGLDDPHDLQVVYVAAKATYIRLIHGKIGISEFGGVFGPSSVHRGRSHIVLG